MGMLRTSQRPTESGTAWLGHQGRLLSHTQLELLLPQVQRLETAPKPQHDAGNRHTGAGRGTGPASSRGHVRGRQLPGDLTQGSEVQPHHWICQTTPTSPIRDYQKQKTQGAGDRQLGSPLGTHATKS